MAQKDFISRYNQFSGYFWLLIAIVSFIVVTYKIFTEGMQTWLPYYVVPVMALTMFFIKKWMMKRMTRHLNAMTQEKSEPNV
jgi:ABC-type polysaccharide/polyol phosphate export permease